jgi:hypothetical protein
MMLSSLSNLALSTLERSAPFIPSNLLKFIPGVSLDATQNSFQRQEVKELNNIKQIFQKHFPTQSQQVLQHQAVAQSALTVIVPIYPEKQQQLRTYLEGSTDSINRYFSQSSSTHFARFVILEDEPQGIKKPYLLFSSTHDGNFETYMDELVGLTKAASPQTDVLNTIFGYCQGYVPFASRDAKLFSDFIHRHTLPSNTFFMAYWNKSVPEIKDSSALYNELHQSLENSSLCTELSRNCNRPASLNDVKPQKPTVLKSGFITQKFEEFLEKYWVKIRPVQNDPGYHLQSNPTQLARRHESKVVEDRIVQNQVLIAQNQFLTLHAIDPGFLGTNLLILKVILWLAAGRAKKAKGNLSGIPTIHSLRWVIIPSGMIGVKPYLLFESNYNGSWDSYVDDFVQYACRRMNLIWGKCQDYRSQGAQDTEWFKQHIRNYLFPAQAYYSAYPDLTVRNILTCLRVAEVVKATQNSAQNSEADQAERSLISLKLLLAGAYHCIN